MHISLYNQALSMVFQPVLPSTFHNFLYLQFTSEMAYEIVWQDLIKQNILYLLCVSYADSFLTEGNYLSEFT